ncbi:hypothetical protein AB5I41_09600 [Sphingomonas sp. MMS24-JH45]
MLENVLSTIETDPTVNPAAKKRVAAMKEFMAMQDVLVVPAALRRPGATPEPTAASKVLRGIKSIGSDWFAHADKIKSDLRKNPAGYRQARVALDALIAQHKNAKDGDDRLAVHIRFLANACEFGETIGDWGAALEWSSSVVSGGSVSGKFIRQDRRRVRGFRQRYGRQTSRDQMARLPPRSPMEKRHTLRLAPPSRRRRLSDGEVDTVIDRGCHPSQ